MLRGTMLLCLFLSGCKELTLSGDPPGRPAENKAAAEASSPADNVTLQILDHDGIQKLIASHRGKVVVMDAWSTSCPPCLKEFPHLVELHHKHGAEKLACVSLSFDYEGIDRPEDQQQKVLAFLQKQKATFDNVLNREEADVLYKQMKMSAVPAVFVYDRQGNLHQRFDGAKVDYTQIAALVDQLLAK